MAYTIRSGDTLSGIAARYKTSVSALLAANPKIKDANVILAGASLNLPGSSDTFDVPARKHTKGKHHHPHPTKPPHPGKTPPPGNEPPPATGHAGTLTGADTSGWQSDATFNASIKNSKWTAIKATEGTGFTDRTFQARWKQLGQAVQKGTMKLRVAYTFLHAGNGAGQAKHFLDVLGIKGKLQPGTRLALDWEAGALSDPKALKDAADYVHKVTGIWPLVYCSASQVSRAKAAVPQAPIWEAKWSGPAPKNVPFVQTSDGPGYDHDVFNGSLKDLEKFAGW